MTRTLIAVTAAVVAINAFAWFGLGIDDSGPATVDADVKVRTDSWYVSRNPDGDCYYVYAPSRSGVGVTHFEMFPVECP